MPCEMSFEEEMPKVMTGWMLKRKAAGARTKILGDANKRFFTLDFENQILFYSHSESQKQVSLPIPFSEIVSAEAAGNTDAPDTTTQASTKNGRFSMPKLPKMPTRNAGWSHGIVVHGKARKLELLLNSEEEASKWLAALQTAQRMGLTKRNGESDPDLVKAEQSTAAGSSGCSGSGSSTPHGGSPRDCIPEVIGKGDVLNESGSSQQPTSILENVVLDADAVDPEPPLGQAANAGKTNVAVGQKQKRRQQEKKYRHKSHNVDNSQPGTSAWGQACRAPQVDRYADQGKGLSLQERLERLEFSDDDEDGEENLVPKHTGPLNVSGAQEVVKGGYSSKASGQAVVESCEAEPFEAFDSEDESQPK